MDGEELKKAGYLELYEDYCYDDCTSVLIRLEDGKPPIVIQSDCGEPEDQMFGRNYDEFVEEINFLNNKLNNISECWKALKKSLNDMIAFGDDTNPEELLAYMRDIEKKS